MHIDAAPSRICRSNTRNACSSLPPTCRSTDRHPPTAAEFADPGFDRGIIAESGGDKKAAVNIDEGVSGEVVEFQIFALSHAERPLDQSARAGVEDGEITRIIDDAGRIAVTPLDPHDA